MLKNNPINSQEILEKATVIQPQMSQWRRTIHRYPELSFNEVKTARLVNTVLHDLGIETETGVAKTGVVGHIEGDGPLIGLRADMDALPIQEENGTAFDSNHAGIMHACGHDAHTAILLGAATILKGFADEGRLPGGVRLLFQPSEEDRDDKGKSGGMLMVEEGVLNGVDAIFGLHVDPGTDVGKVGTRAGGMMAAGDIVEMTVRGAGGHGARPHLANDPLVLSAHLLLVIQDIVSRRLDPLESGVISLTTIYGGIVSNVIPDSVQMTGTVRSLTSATRQRLHEELRRACTIVEALGGQVDLKIIDGYPPMFNNPEATGVAFKAIGEMLGEEKVFEKTPVMASEDFSFMLQEVPGCFLRLGVQNPNWDRVYPVHTATFQLDEDALRIGAASLVATAVEWMQQKG